MARLWDALKPAVGASAPWSLLPGAAVAVPSSDPELPPKTGAASLAGPAEIRADATRETSGEAPDDGGEERLLDQARGLPEVDDLEPSLELTEAAASPVWADHDQSTAFLEVGPKDDIHASQGVALPQFTWKPALLTESLESEFDQLGEARLVPPAIKPVSIPAKEPTAQAKPAQAESDFPRIARHRKHLSQVPVQGPVSAGVVEGIMERLLQRTAADVNPWLFLSPPMADAGLAAAKIDDIVQKVLEGLLAHCGEICVLELDGPADGSSVTVGPGWHEVLLGRVDIQGALRPGRKEGIWRFPSGAASAQSGPWFAARSIHGVARELRQKFPLVVVSSPTGTTAPVGRLWTNQCQGWTWVVSSQIWETTQLEESAQALTKAMPPWIGCVLVDE